MKLLVFEYITCGGLINEALPKALATEGDLMVRALVNDLLELSDVELIIPRDPRLAMPEFQADQARLNLIELRRSDEFKRIWQGLLNVCDAVWPIAPETDHILRDLCQSVQDAGKILLNSLAAAVELTTSKLATASLLEERAVSVVPTFALNRALSLSEGPWVLKPDDGVGCENIRIIQGKKTLEGIDLDALDGEWIVQPLIAGETISLSVLCRRGEARLLSCNQQQVKKINGGFRLSGCVVNGVRDAAGRYQQLAGRIARALPELWGYVGVDLIVSSNGPIVLEINPRLTTSYIGLHQALGINPAELVIRLLDGEHELMPAKWYSASTAVSIKW